ncbi:hypothetical protein CEE37_05255 [candidate division LCP-89 bacterium B3_LCP]|uniref:Secretion system C-terminal sorting domain-containing protein n=1 Tax=candidate division LCP-89 bacterium B3_LCP TaxID=2012998 RepID=A0A532V1J8_UNCL8|nr:MAG: hypothetical protein CEE37_05255 [candidate division LCP-89 bacterium B3_LCP]
MKSRMYLKIVFIVITILMACSLTVQAQDSSGVTKLGELYDYFGGVNTVVISGDCAYGTFGSEGLRIVDISNPAEPAEMSRLVTSDLALDVAVQGGYAYVAAYNAGLLIINVSDPYNPHEVGSVPGWHVLGVEVSGNYAYVANDASGGLRVVDVSNPIQPFEVGFCLLPGNAQDVAVAGDYAYVVLNYFGFAIVNVSDPANPRQMSTLDTPGCGYHIAVSGDYAYEADGSGGLRIFDVSNPLFPYEVGTCSTPGSARGVALSGDYAFVADWINGLRVIDVSSPNHPTEIAYYETQSIAQGAAMYGDYVCVADTWSGMRMIDVSNPLIPLEVGAYYEPSQIQGLFVVGDYAYLLDEYAGLRIVDVCDPHAPLEIGSYEPLQGAEDIIVSGGYAYIAMGSEGLWILDMSYPISPVLTGIYDTPGSVLDIDMFTDDYICVADAMGGLRIIYIVDPIHPVEVGYLPAPPCGLTRSVDVAGIFAYVGDDISLRVVNIADPTAPYEMGSCTLMASPYEIVVWDGHAYVACYYAGLKVVNVTDPTTPFVEGEYDTPGYAYGVALPSDPISDDYVFIADWDEGLRVINVMEPSSPFEVGFYDTPGYAYDVFSDRNLAYIADMSYFGIYDPAEAMTPTVEITITPSNPPIYIPSSGGSFDFTVNLLNMVPSPVACDAWIMVQLPDESWYGPVLGPVSVDLAAGSSLSRERTQNVPASAPPGEYIYEGRVGFYPDMAWDYGNFTFEKLEAGDGVPLANWSNSGESFDMWFSESNEVIPSEFEFLNAHPNPFNPITVISFSLPVAGLVTLEVFDIGGKRVGVGLAPTRQYPPGTHSILFDGSNLSSGIYFARLTAGDYTQTQKLVLMK